MEPEKTKDLEALLNDFLIAEAVIGKLEQVNNIGKLSKAKSIYRSLDAQIEESLNKLLQDVNVDSFYGE